MQEKTFVMLKPDCLKRGYVGEVTQRIEKKGFKIDDLKMATLSAAFLKKHYAHLSDQPFFPDIVEYMLSGPVIGMIVSGENCILGMRLLAGATNFENALPGTIRGDFANCTRNNIIHCSDSPETAHVEIERFFGAELVLETIK